MKISEVFNLFYENKISLNDLFENLSKNKRLKIGQSNHRNYGGNRYYYL
jgi:hypothetical protein